MKVCLILLATFCLYFVSHAQSTGKNARKEAQISISNPLNRARENVMVFIPEEQLKSNFEFNSMSFVVLENGKPIAADFVNDHQRKGVVFVVDKLGAGAEKTFVINTSKSTTAFTKKTQAELSHRTGGAWKNREYIGGTFRNVKHLRVPPEHKDHSWFIRYEGPGWESDKVGYRFYLDQRNATDVFGKLNSGMVLQNVGQDNFDSYHELQPWGMDIMKVGKSLGIGSIGAIDKNGAVARVEKTDSVNCAIAMNGNIYSSIETNYKGWSVGQQKTDLRSLISIHGGTRLTHQELNLGGAFAGLCTGIVKDTSAILIRESGSKKAYGFIATYGKQSLNNDELGLVVFFKPENFLEFTADDFSNIVKLKTIQNKVDYYFAAAWVREPGGIVDEKAFREYIQQTAEELANPILVKVSKGPASLR
jgi:hypothetical protein